MFGEENWDDDFSSGPTTTQTSYRNDQQNSFSPKSPVNGDSTKRTFIGRGRGKMSNSGFNSNQAPGSGFSNSNSGGFSNNDSGGFGGGGFKPRGNKYGDDSNSSRDYQNGVSSNGDQGGFGGGGFKSRSNKYNKRGEEGHMSRNYPSGGQSDGDQGGFGGRGGGFKQRSNKCYKCGEEGHISRNCPSGSNGDSGFGGGSRREGGFGRKNYGDDRGDSGGFGSSNNRKGGFGKKSFGDDRGDSGSFGGGFGSSSNREVGFGRKSFGDDRGDSGGFNDRGSREGGFGKKSYNNDRRDNGGFGSRNNRESDFGKKSFGDDRGDSGGFGGGFGDSDSREGGFGKKSFNDDRGGDAYYDASRDNEGGFGRRSGGGFNKDSNGSESRPRNSNCFKCDQPGHLARDCPNQDSGANDKVTTEKYIPPAPPEDEDKMFESLQRGINFSKYNDIKVEISGENCPRHISTFEEAHLTETIARNVQRAKYETPTPVQKYSIPIISSGRDLMACAQTGSGKTAAFLLPALTMMIKDGLKSSSFSESQEPQAIIVGPTRELVNQIYLEARKFARGSICRACVAYGGTSVGYQLGEIRKGCNILIATPGRLMDFVNKGRIGLNHVQFLILDEADRMLDMGFEEEIRKLASSTGMPPKESRQTLMFSATFPDEIQKLAHDFLKEDFIFLAVGIVGGACSDVTQNIIQIDQNDKREKLHELLEDVNKTRARTLVFVETKRSADFLACSLSQAGYPTTSIHGDRLQREREEALRDFKRGEYPILIATSVAARGLDIPKVEHVINYDLPKDIDEYVHRIGRTGRCGNLGRATSFFDNSKDSEVARCLIRTLADSQQEVPAWLESCAEGAIGTNFGTTRGGFGGRDARKRGNQSNDNNFSNGGGSRATGDFDYNDGGGFGATSSFGGNTGSGGGGFGGGDDFGGGDESWD